MTVSETGQVALSFINTVKQGKLKELKKQQTLRELHEEYLDPT
jgi:hypothetical protein